MSFDAEKLFRLFIFLLPLILLAIVVVKISFNIKRLWNIRSLNASATFKRWIYIRYAITLLMLVFVACFVYYTYSLFPWKDFSTYFG
jgi:hypothetical protein